MLILLPFQERDFLKLAPDKYHLSSSHIWNVFQNAFAAQLALQIRRLPPQIRRLLPRIRRFLPKKWKASSEERWVCTHISFWNRVQLCLQIFRIYICVFQAAFVMERFLQMHVIFKDTYHTCRSLKKRKKKRFFFCTVLELKVRCLCSHLSLAALPPNL